MGIDDKRKALTSALHLDYIAIGADSHQPMSISSPGSKSRREDRLIVSSFVVEVKGSEIVPAGQLSNTLVSGDRYVLIRKLETMVLAIQCGSPDADSYTGTRRVGTTPSVMTLKTVICGTVSRRMVSVAIEV